MDKKIRSGPLVLGYLVIGIAAAFFCWGLYKLFDPEKNPLIGMVLSFVFVLLFGFAATRLRKKN